eukprot:968892-Pleurochrysis_carterae.AAC.1
MRFVTHVEDEVRLLARGQFLNLDREVEHLRDARHNKAVYLHTRAMQSLANNRCTTHQIKTHKAFDYTYWINLQLAHHLRARATLTNLGYYHTNCGYYHLALGEVVLDELLEDLNSLVLRASEVVGRDTVAVERGERTTPI